MKTDCLFTCCETFLCHIVILIINDYSCFSIKDIHEPGIAKFSQLLLLITLNFRQLYSQRLLTALKLPLRSKVVSLQFNKKNFFSGIKNSEWDLRCRSGITDFPCTHVWFFLQKEERLLGLISFTNNLGTLFRSCQTDTQEGMEVQKSYLCYQNECKCQGH